MTDTNKARQKYIEQGLTAFTRWVTPEEAEELRKVYARLVKRRNKQTTTTTK